MEARIREQAEAYAVACRLEQEELLKRLGCIPAPTRQEDARASFCRDWFISAGATDVRIDAAKNVVCRYGCETNDELVVFMAHTDIVFPDLEPLPMRQEGRLLYAPGIGDDTANLVNLMMAFKYLLTKQVKMNCGLLVVANACEEGLGNLDGCKEIMREYGKRVRAFYSFDGHMGQCCPAAVGSHRYKISVSTPGGHSYLNFGAANAIHLLAGLIQDLYRIKLPEQGITTYNVGKIEGGTTVNTIAQEASMLYEFRSTSQASLQEMEREMNGVLAGASGEGCAVVCELLGVRPGNGPVDAEALQAFTERNVDVIRSFFSGDVYFDAFSTDANVPLSQGIVANTIGTVVGDKAHTREEWVDLDSMPSGLKIALSLMLHYAES